MGSWGLLASRDEEIGDYLPLLDEESKKPLRKTKKKHVNKYTGKENFKRRGDFKCC